MKYCVTVVRSGCVFVDAENECEAMDIADRQMTDSILWSDDWSSTDVVEDDSYEDCMYIKDKAFE